MFDLRIIYFGLFISEKQNNLSLIEKGGGGSKPEKSRLTIGNEITKEAERYEKNKNIYFKHGFAVYGFFFCFSGSGSNL